MASVCALSVLSVGSERPLAEEILMRPDGNFTHTKKEKAYIMEPAHFLILLLEPVSLFVLAEKMGAADATAGSPTPSGLCSLNN